MNCGLARGELDTAVDHDLILDLLVSHLWIQAPSATASRPSASLTERCASATTARGSTLTAHRARGPSLQREEVMTSPDQATDRGTATGPTGHQQPAMPRPRCSAFPVQLVHAVLRFSSPGHPSMVRAAAGPAVPMGPILRLGSGTTGWRNRVRLHRCLPGLPPSRSARLRPTLPSKDRGDRSAAPPSRHGATERPAGNPSACLRQRLHVRDRNAPYYKTKSSLTLTIDVKLTLHDQRPGGFGSTMPMAQRRGWGGTFVRGARGDLSAWIGHGRRASTACRWYGPSAS